MCKKGKNELTEIEQNELIEIGKEALKKLAEAEGRPAKELLDENKQQIWEKILAASKKI